MFSDQTHESSERIIATAKTAMYVEETESYEKPHTLENYSIDHFLPPAKRTLSKALQSQVKRREKNIPWAFSKVCKGYWGKQGTEGVAPQGAGGEYDGGWKVKNGWRRNGEKRRLRGTEDRSKDWRIEGTEKMEPQELDDRQLDEGEEWGRRDRKGEGGKKDRKRKGRSEEWVKRSNWGGIGKLSC